MSRQETPEERVARAMGPVPAGWKRGAGASWVWGSVTISVAGAGLAEWQVRRDGKLVATVSSREAALAHANQAAAESSATGAHLQVDAGGRQVYPDGSVELRAPKNESAMAPPSVDPWKAFGLAVMELVDAERNDGGLRGEPLAVIAAALKRNRLLGQSEKDLGVALRRARELEVRITRLVEAADRQHRDSPKETWHRLTTAQGSCAVWELVTEAGLVVTRRQVVEKDRREVQWPKVEDLMGKAAR